MSESKSTSIVCPACGSECRLLFRPIATLQSEDTVEIFVADGPSLSVQPGLYYLPPSSEDCSACEKLLPAGRIDAALPPIGLRRSR